MCLKRQSVQEVSIKNCADVLTHHCLEAGVEVCEEGRFVSQCQDPLLHHRTFNIVILDHNVFLQDLYGVQLLCRLHLCQHHLSTKTRGQNEADEHRQVLWLLNSKCLQVS